jgi:hypothetical protein
MLSRAENEVRADIRLLKPTLNNIRKPFLRLSQFKQNPGLPMNYGTVHSDGVISYCGQTVGTGFYHADAKIPLNCLAG